MIDIKETINQSGLNQKDFAAMLDRMPEQISRWYNGRRMLSPMTEERVRRICKENDIEVFDKKS